MDTHQIRIAELSSALDELLPMNADRQERLDKKFRLEFNYNTNHLEGNTLTYSETELLLIFDRTKGDHTAREYEEMKAHDAAFKMIKELALEKERPLTESFIKDLNEVILVKPFWKDAITQDGHSTRKLIKIGNYKEFPNSVKLSNGEIFNYASVSDTPILMAELVEWYRQAEAQNEITPVELAGRLHYQFVLIHPFDDGNGRIARLLMNYVLIKHDLPPVIIKSTDKAKYLTALNYADAGDINAFMGYISEQLIWSLEISLKAAKGENIDEPGDLDKKLKLLKSSLNATEDDEVRLERSKEVVLKTFNESIVPFLRLIKTKMKTFDALFKDRQILASSENQEIVGIEEILDGNRKLEIELGRKVFFSYTLKKFRKPSKKTFDVSIHLHIIFNKLVYEIILISSSNSISKLYHNPLSENEMIEMYENLGNELYNQIEKELEKTNKP